jgi:hypothetical protein
LIQKLPIGRQRDPRRAVKLPHDFPSLFAPEKHLKCIKKALNVLPRPESGISYAKRIVLPRKHRSIKEAKKKLLCNELLRSHCAALAGGERASETTREKKVFAHPALLPVRFLVI